MTTSEGLTAIHVGQLSPELRNRDSSGFQSQLLNLRAFVSDIGPPCWVDGPTAHGLFGIRGFPLRPPFHVLIPRKRWMHRVGHVVHQTLDLPAIDRETAHGLDCVSPTRAIINMARSQPISKLELAISSALELGLTNDDLLHRRIVDLRDSGRHGIPRLVELLESRELASGAASWLERELLRLIRRSGLPTPQTQQIVGRRKDRLIRVDFRWPGTPIVVEALGYRWHRSPLQMSVDAERMNEMVAAGWLCLQFTYQHITTDPDYVVGKLRGLLERF